MDAIPPTAGCCEGSKPVGQIFSLTNGAPGSALACMPGPGHAGCAYAWPQMLGISRAANRVLTLKVHDSGQFGWASRQGVVAE